SLTPTSAKLKGLKVTDPQGALKNVVAEIGDKAKAIVVLSQLGKHAADKKMADTVDYPFIWVGDDADLAMDWGITTGKRLHLDGQRLGYYLGRAVISIKTPNPGFYSQKVIGENKHLLEGMEKALAATKTPANREKIEKRIAAFKAAQTLEAPAGASEFDHEAIALSQEKYGKANAVTEMIAKEKERIKSAAIGKGAKH
ncbi:hypothetical protein K2X33_07020, partial [bacterium]|nr:hypothetical protein [bacterium]